MQINQFCSDCKKTWKWNSQPIVKDVPAGNLLMSCGILYSGSLPTKTIRVFEIISCYSISSRTFFRHQNYFLEPAVEKVWYRHQQRFVEYLIESEHNHVVISGDGRCDSPGHCAKFGSYTVIECRHNKVLDFKLVQVRS